MVIIKYYFNLTKPGIIVGNVMSVIGGGLLASQGNVSNICYNIFSKMLLGIVLIIASSCVFNNIIDYDIDSVMERTKNRMLLVRQNIVSLNTSIIYACVLGISGFLFLWDTKNNYTIYLTIIGVLIYIGVYSLWMKRKSIYSVMFGSISGAIPPVIGYCTVANKFDIGAIILLVIFSLWQIPHSYSILILRMKDYKQACIPTFPIKKGLNLTRYHIIIYIFIFSIANILLTITGYTSSVFMYIISSINLYWLYFGIYGYAYAPKYYLWSKKMFLLSIIIIMLLNILLSLDSFLFLHK